MAWPRFPGVARREFLTTSLTAAGSLLGAAGAFADAPAIITPDRARPRLPSGVQAGDVSEGRAVIWSRADRPARLVVEYATSDSFRGARRVRGPIATRDTGFTARVDLRGLPAGQEIFYRVHFEDVSSPRVRSEPAVGRFRTAPVVNDTRRNTLVVWGGDVVGQGWGINPEWGGLRIYEAMHRLQPDLFIHSGDHIYADNPLVAEVRLDEGRIWRNVVTEAKSKVAETLDEFRGAYAYNLMDEHLQRFNARVPILAQWDDHETLNNWFPGEIVDDERYTERRASVLAARGKRALFEYVPFGAEARANARVYRVCRCGPLLDIFVLDERSYRGPNTANLQASSSPATQFLGREQMTWLKRELQASRAVWKVIATDMPLAYVIADRLADGSRAMEGWANADGPPLGRELELAEVLRFIKSTPVANVVWVTADVHHSAAHHYHPDRAAFRDFNPFWEFVAGPLHAGTFGPSALDRTFGPEVKFNGFPPGTKGGRPPSDGLQFFGALAIDAQSAILDARIHNLTGDVLYRVDLEPSHD